MQQVDFRVHIEKRLPARLVKALYEVAEKYETKGVKLFVFGSFARLKDINTSDLDIGVIWRNKRNPHLFTQLYHDIQELPTMRKIDLVDMEQVDENFKRKALKEGMMLFNEDIAYEQKQ